MSELPEDLEALLAEYGRHLRLGRNRSAHTVRAYVGDARALLEHLLNRAVDSGVGEVDLALLRAWLAA
ncbi:recombinase XerC, partial [Nocardia seriolae]|uniref:site-specific integrase n=1 Tax=Nocardia seriolae TaxID=37332 RepID=UPI0013279E01